uniref:Variant surface glycoprotein 1125.166 n=1 Tax=Trypanosoma brucei TaxID=5691 RepID=A0A1J0R5D1_9TRYP|nr:variant surface glycoprotein 1125.166 [Trypanosoma brucei]
MTNGLAILQLSVLTAATAFMMLTRRGEATNYALKGEVWVPLCDVARELRKTARQTVNKIDSSLNANEQLERLYLQLLVYAAKNPTAANSENMRILAYGAAVEIAANTNQVKTNLPAAIKAISYGHEVSGSISGALHTLKYAVESPYFCLQQTGGTADGQSYITPEKCGELTVDVRTDGEDIDDAIVWPNGFGKVTGTSNTEGQGQSGKCGVFKTTTGTNTNPGIKIGSGGKASFAHGLIEATSDEKPNGKPLSNLAPHGKLTETDLLSKTHKAVRQLMAIPTSKKHENEEALIKHLISKPAIITAIKLQMAATTGKTVTDATTESDVKLRENYFGTGDTTAKGLWNKIANEQVVDETGKEKPEPKLAQIVDTDKLRKVLEYYQTLQNVRQAGLVQEIEKLKKDSEIGKTVTPEKICNKIGDADENKCNRTKGCAYNKTGEANKKCTLSEEGKKEAAKQAENQETEEKNWKTDSKCTGKKQKDCKDGCKWENRKCKDYSFLVNQNFTLSMAASFVNLVLF